MSCLTNTVLGLDEQRHNVNLTPDLIDARSDTPLYRQVIDLLRHRIVSGEAENGSRLPPEQALTGMLGVSRITVKRALNELAVSGLVSRQRGRGTIVTFDPAAPVVKGRFQDLMDGLTRMGLQTQVRLLSTETEPASPAIAERLNLAPGAPIRRIVRARSLEGEPFSHLVAHFSTDIADQFTPNALETQSLLKLLENAGHAAVAADQSIGAAAADAEIADSLGVSQGSPVLRIQRVMIDANGRPVQDIIAHYRADRFQYHIRLARQSDADWTQEN